MKINVRLNPQSIQDAVIALTKAKMTLRDKMVDELLSQSVEQIKQLANERLLMADIGENVKNDILNNWKTEKLGNVVVLKNVSQKAVFVEFGVGIVGQQSPHKNATEAGYQYNKPSRYKRADGSWIFKIDDESNLDISLKNVDNRTTHTVRTKGQVGYMYLYNAIIDFADRKLAKKIWENIKLKYWG